MSTPAESRDRLLSTLDSRLLNIIVLPTEQCNFSCVYCYESFSLRAMTRDTINAVGAFIERRAPTLSALSVEWFGGEPLLAMDAIRRISRVALATSRTHEFTYRSGMTTNGWFLTPVRVAELLGLGVSTFKVTLDGPAAVHDRVRPLRSGGPTHSVIMKNLLDVHASDSELQVVVRLHFRPTTIDAVAEEVAKFVDALGGDDRFTFELQPIRRLGGANDEEMEAYGSDDEFQTDLAKLGEFLPPAAIHSIPCPYICYAAAANSIVVRANGRLSKCTVALDAPINDIGLLLPDGRISLDTPKVHAWIRGVESLNGDELACPWSGLKGTQRTY